MIETDLPPIHGRAENFWRIADLRSGVEPVYWRGFLDRPAPDLTDCLAEHLPGRPWLLQLWEPLLTKAPSPARAQPYCCYARTVVFYHRPYIVRPRRWYRSMDGQLRREEMAGFVEWDQIQTRLGWDDVIAFDGDHFEIAGGMVHWHNRRWWIHRTARRKAKVVELAA